MHNVHANSLDFATEYKRFMMLSVIMWFVEQREKPAQLEDKS